MLPAAPPPSPARRAAPRALLLASTLLLLLVAIARADGSGMPPSAALDPAHDGPIAVHALPPFDAARAAADADRAARGPHVFADRVAIEQDPATFGTWTFLGDADGWLWRVRITAPGARHLNLAFDRVALPASARLWLYGDDGSPPLGPYDAGDVAPDGQLWTPLVAGDAVTIELHVPPPFAPGAIDAAPLRVVSVQRGFRAPRPAATRGIANDASRIARPGPAALDASDAAGSCHASAACASAQPWRAQRDAVVWYTILGTQTCTATLMATTARDVRPLLLSAAHCGVRADTASTIVTYWNDRRVECPPDAPDDGGTMPDGGPAVETRAGAALRVRHERADVVLFELLEMPPAGAIYAGWDARDQRPGGVAATLHHPRAVDQRISRARGPYATFELADPPAGPPAGRPASHLRVDGWLEGATEPGSSGACLFDAAGRCRGVLTGGDSSCDAPDAPDFFGRLARAWQADTPDDNALGPWLDPLAQGAIRQLDGHADAAAACAADAAAPDGVGVAGGDEILCLGDGRFRAVLAWRDFEGMSQLGRVAAAQTADSGLFYFRDPLNWELLVKVIDGCAINGNRWLFAAGVTNVAWTLDVVDRQTGDVVRATNEAGQPSPAAIRTDAFPSCP